LRNYPDAKRAYAALKRDLAKQYADDLLTYQRAKLPFVQDILTLSGGVSGGSYGQDQ
jgi:GrpB-like predicted nucleotidyltransferase (UPF0157 family)